MALHLFDVSQGVGSGLIARVQRQHAKPGVLGGVRIAPLLGGLGIGLVVGHACGLALTGGPLALLYGPITWMQQVDDLVAEHGGGPIPACFRSCSMLALLLHISAHRRRSGCRRVPCAAVRI